MKLTYFGHSSFLVQAQDGTRIIIDPYRSGAYEGAVKYDPVGETADVVVASHEHDDHGACDTVPGNPKIYVHPDQVSLGKVTITGIHVAHDEKGGSERGKNTLIVIDDADIRLVHLGDLGHTLDETTIKALGRVDVLLVPVGGFFTIDHKQAAKVVEAVNPRVVIPMHYKTDRVDFPIARVDDFLATQTRVEYKDSPTIELTSSTLPTERTVMVLPHAR